MRPEGPDLRARLSGVRCPVRSGREEKTSRSRANFRSCKRVLLPIPRPTCYAPIRRSPALHGAIAECFTAGLVPAPVFICRDEDSLMIEILESGNIRVKIGRRTVTVAVRRGDEESGPNTLVVELDGIESWDDG